jgi:hypothetical protein
MNTDLEHSDSPPPPVEAPASQRRSRLRLAGIGLAIAVVVVAAAGFAITRAGAIASTTAATPSPSSSHSAHRPSFGRGGFGFSCGAGFTSAGFGAAAGGFCGGETGTVTKISGSTLTLRMLAGTVTVTTSSSTKYSREGHQVSFSAIKVGEVVAVRRSHTGTSKMATSPIAAAAITIEVPSVSGRVQSVSGNTITLVTSNGQLEYVTTSGATSYNANRGATASSGSVKASVYIIAQGTQTDLTHLTADDIQVLGTSNFALHPFPAFGSGGPGQHPSAEGNSV